jgi:hypothetical protein
MTGRGGATPRRPGAGPSVRTRVRAGAGHRGGWRRRLLVPSVVAVVAAVAAFVSPVASTGAFYTATTTGATADAGTGQWCAAPDPAVSGSRFVRLSSLPVATGNTRMAIVPVANNAAWGGGTGSKGFGVRLWGCSDTPPNDTLRVTAWANPASPIPAATWLANNGVAPSSRLDTSAGLGLSLRTLALAATVDATKPLIGNSSGDARRYSWLVANGRTNTTQTADPTTCQYVLNLLIYCSFPLTNSSSGDNTFAQTFNTSPWTTPNIVGVDYTARTLAIQSTTGWSNGAAYLNSTCGVLGLLICTTNPAATTLSGTAATDASLLASSDGNQLQWLVIQWTGTTAPTSDLVLETFLQ